MRLSILRKAARAIIPLHALTRFCLETQENADSFDKTASLWDNPADIKFLEVGIIICREL